MVTPTYFGFNPPFYGGQQGILSRQVDERLIKNDLLQLLLTLPGERKYRPTFGTKIRAVIFENFSSSDVSGLQQNIIAAINTYEERVTINAVNVIITDDGQTIMISVNVSPIFNPLSKYLIEIGVSPTGIKVR